MCQLYVNSSNKISCSIYQKTVAYTHIDNVNFVTEQKNSPSANVGYLSPNIDRKNKTLIRDD